MGLADIMGFVLFKYGRKKIIDSKEPIIQINSKTS